MTLAYTAPLIAHLTSAIPGVAKDHDVATMVWNVAWVRQALNSGGDLLRTDAVLLPFGADLRLHTYGLLQGLMAYPFTGLLGAVGAFNLMLIVNLWLNGAALYALIYAETENMPAAVVAASWVMLSAPLVFHFSVGRPSFAALWIVALALLWFRGLLDQPRLWKGVALGLALFAALLSDFQIVFYAALWLTLYGITRLIRDGRRLLERQRMITLGLAGLIFLIPFIAFFYPALANAKGSGYQQPVLDGMTLFSFRLQDYVTPQTVPLIYGYDMLVAVLAAPFILRRASRYRAWLLSALFILLLALGPFLQVPSGNTHIPLPFAAFSLWSPLLNFRTPYRLALPAQLGLGVVAGYVLAALLARVRPRFVIGFLTVAVILRLLMTFDHDPLRIQTYPTYAIYDQIAAEPGDFAILEVPFGVRSGLDRIGQGGEILQYYQAIHGKRLLNGMIARLPGSVLSFYRQHMALIFLSGETTRLKPELDSDFAEVLAWSGARYVLVHRALLDDFQIAQIEGFLNRQPVLERLGVESDLVIYLNRS